MSETTLDHCYRAIARMYEMMLNYRYHAKNCTSVQELRIAVDDAHLDDSTRQNLSTLDRWSLTLEIAYVMI